MAVVGFWNGAMVGAASGFAAGFTGAALNTWTGGGNLGDGLAAGFRAGVQGALIGAAVGGVTGHLRQVKENKFFAEVKKSLGVSPEDVIPATDENLNKLQKMWFPDAPMEKVKKFTVENLSDGAKKYFAKHPNTGGITTGLKDALVIIQEIQMFILILKLRFLVPKNYLIQWDMSLFMYLNFLH
jgi:hypothetical protein